jgi:(E)-4-hydroxy-3-methylbut-2-enyl-diphosphate synthase
VITLFTNDKTKQINAGGLLIGGGAPVSIQSMLSVKSDNIEGNVAQAVALEKAGCEIIRVSVPDLDAVRLVSALKENVSVPIVADIHFDYKLALESVAAGVDKVRINPGNIGSDDKVKAVAVACKNAGVPIRIGVNSGSLEKNILAKYGSPTPEAMVESGLYHISLLEKFDFDDIVLSLKSSDTQRMYDAYVLAAEKCRYPLHLGVTEAGTERMGVIKSAAGVGGLLLRGIGGTIRISLTDDPVLEVKAAKDLLRAIGLRNEGIKFVSCPTCGRTSIDLIGLAKAAEERFAGINKNITVAIMGCAVNGPGEAKEADLGIAGGNGCGLLFSRGEILRKVPEDKLLDALYDEIMKFGE